MENSGKRIAAFDGVRGVAIGLVVVGHCIDAHFHPSTNAQRILASVAGNSSFGVRLFFVLSGYLITTLLLREGARHGRISLRAFYARRALRIFPAFYAFLTVVAGLCVAGVFIIHASELITAAIYMWNYSGLWIRARTHDGSWFLGHLWTLSLEEQFYLFWPVLIVTLSRRAIGILCTAAIFIVPTVRIASYFLFPAQRGYLGMMFHTAIDSILIGCWYALFGAPITRWIGRQRSLVAVAIMAAAIPSIISPVLRELFGGKYAMTLGISVDAAAAGFLILAIHLAQRLRLFSTLLEFAPLVALGRISYSLYVWQQLFLTTLNRTWTGGFPLSVGASIAAATLSYFLIERPFLLIKDHFSRARVGR